MHLLKLFSLTVDSMNKAIGLVVMYILFMFVAVLLWSSISKTFFLPSLWTLEVAQFIMVAYYMLGGPYSILLGSSVRMDLFYGNWSIGRKALVDTITVFFLLFYLAVMLYGALGSTAYSLGYWGSEPLIFFKDILIGTEEIGRLERSSSAWRPYLWPVKLVMIIALFLMIIQVLSELCKDIITLHSLKRGNKQ